MIANVYLCDSPQLRSSRRHHPRGALVRLLLGTRMLIALSSRLCLRTRI